MTEFNNDAAKKLFASRLKTKLKEREMNQNTLADLIGVSESTVGKWTLGKSMPRTMGVIEKICSIFNVEKSYFLEQDPPAAPPSAQEAAEPYKAPLTKRDELTEHEREHIELYRELDERGRNAVDDLTDLHVERVRESTERSSSSTGTEIADEKQA